MTVTTTGGTSATTAADLFTYAAGPSVASITPTQGPLTGGTSVTVTGANFTPASTVHFGGTTATSVTTSNATTITAVSPAGTGAVDVTVTTAGGTSATSAADLFTYAVVPIVTAIAPTAGPINRVARLVTVTGTGFTAGSTSALGWPRPPRSPVTSTTSLVATTSPGSASSTSTIHDRRGHQRHRRRRPFQLRHHPGPQHHSPRGRSLGRRGQQSQVSGTASPPPSTVSFGATRAPSVTVTNATTLVATVTGRFGWMWT